MTNQFFIIIFSIMISSTFVYGQTEIGYQTDINGNTLDGFSSVFKNTNANSIMISFPYQDYSYGNVTLKDGTRKEGLIKLGKKKLNIKNYNTSYPTAIKLKSIQSINTGLDSFIVANNVMVNGINKKEIFIKYLFELDGRDYGEYYLNNGTNITQEILYKKKEDKQWATIKYKSNYYLEAFFGYSTLETDELHKILKDGHWDNFQKGNMRFNTGTSSPIYYKFKGKNISYKKRLSDMYPTKLEINSIIDIHSPIDSIFIIHSYKSRQGTYYEKDFFARYLWNNDKVKVAIIPTSIPIYLKSNINENTWVQIMEPKEQFELYPEGYYGLNNNEDLVLIHKIDSPKKLLNYLYLRRFKSYYKTKKTLYYNKSWLPISSEKSNYSAKVTAENSLFYELSYFEKDQLKAKVQYQKSLDSRLKKNKNFKLYHNGKLYLSQKYKKETQSTFVDVYYPNSEQLFYSYSYKDNNSDLPSFHFYSNFFKEDGTPIHFYDQKVSIKDPLNGQIMHNTFSEDLLVESYVENNNERFYYNTSSTYDVDLNKITYLVNENFSKEAVSSSIKEYINGTVYLSIDLLENEEMKYKIIGSINTDFDSELQKTLQHIETQIHKKMKPIKIDSDNTSFNSRILIPINFTTLPYKNSNTDNSWMLHMMNEQQHFQMQQFMHQQMINHVQSMAPTF